MFVARRKVIIYRSSFVITSSFLPPIYKPRNAYNWLFGNVIRFFSCKVEAILYRGW